MKLNESKASDKTHCQLGFGETEDSCLLMAMKIGSFLLKSNLAMRIRKKQKIPFRKIGRSEFILIKSYTKILIMALFKFPNIQNC